MAELKDILAYLIENYPASQAHELSNARLTKMVYLADWHGCINRGVQISNIDWYFDNYGPFVWDIKKTAEENTDLFNVEVGSNMYGGKKRSISLRKPYKPILSEAEKRSLDHIINITSRLYWDDFIRLVYGTHPIASSERYSSLNLREKARDYKLMSAS